MLRRRASRALSIAIAIHAVSACTSIGCAPRREVELPARTRAASSSPAGAGSPIRYLLDIGPAARALDVSIELPRGPAFDLALEDGGERFVHGAHFSQSGREAALEAQGDGMGEDEERIGPCFHAPACTSPTCRLSYRFDLASAARELDELTVAAERGGAFVASPSTFLMHPELTSEGRAFRLEARTPPGVTFTSGLLPAPGGAFAADLSDLPKAPYAALGALRILHWQKEGFSIDIARLPGDLAASDDALLHWVDRAASIVLAWAGRAPIERALVIVLPSEGSGIGFAQTLGNGGASVLVPIGAATTQAELENGWELVHELLHVSFPNLPNAQSWLEEGMATYEEPFARARAGFLTETEVWERLARRLPFGAPDLAGVPLDGSRAWARVYWGGALFCLLADVEIRKQTAGKRSLDDIFRAVLAQGGNVSHRWEITRVIDVGDAATGTNVLHDLYARLGRAVGHVDADALLESLGVTLENDHVKLDDQAPLSAVRRSLVKPL